MEADADSCRVEVHPARDPIPRGEPKEGGRSTPAAEQRQQQPQQVGDEVWERVAKDAARYRAIQCYRHNLNEFLAGRLDEQPRYPQLKPTPRRTVQSDDLMKIDPPDYFISLTGLEVGERGGSVNCPLPGHDERTPSCHVYSSAGRGWYCFGCQRGGTIYDLAGHLWELRTRGEDFKEINQRLRGLFA